MKMIKINDQCFQVLGRVLRFMKLNEEWMTIVECPESVIEEVKKRKLKVDLFTFRQSILENDQKYSYPMEWEEFAVIPISSHDNWLKKQISLGAKRAVKKAFKKNVEVRVVHLSDQFVRGVTDIFNETPIRQGRRYGHYGKSFDAVKKELSRDADKFDFIGAYLGAELIGFIQLGHGRGYVIPFGMVSKIEHRDKSPQNALLSKAVELCEEKGIQYILYGSWSGGGLGEFKRHNGCVKRAVPRYYAPITTIGRIALRFRLHRSLADWVPGGVKNRWVRLRSKLYTRRYSP